MTSNTGLTLAAGFALSFVLAAAGVVPLQLSLAVLAVLAVPLLVIGLLTHRLSTHPCPRCGNPVANGRTICSACGLDAAKS